MVRERLGALRTVPNEPAEPFDEETEQETHRGGADEQQREVVQDVRGTHLNIPLIQRHIT